MTIIIESFTLVVLGILLTIDIVVNTILMILKIKERKLNKKKLECIKENDL